MGFRSSFLALMLLALAGPLCAQVPIADFSAHGSIYGVHNLTVSSNFALGGQQPVAWGEIWVDQVEDNDTILITWLRWDLYTNQANPALLDLMFTPFYTSFDKVTGTALPVAIDVRQGAFTVQQGLNPANFSLYAIEEFRPRVGLTTAPAGAGVDAASIAFSQIDLQAGNKLDAHAAYMGYNAGTGEWEINFNRAEWNISNSAGQSDSVVVAPMDDGDIIYAWRDASTNGQIGAVGNILPMVTFPAAANANDIYARRGQQRFPTIPGPGAEDPAGSTINLSESGGWDTNVTIASDRTANVFVHYAVVGIQTDMVGGAAQGASGPAGGMQGAETDDEYITLIDASLGALMRSDTRNISQSLGGGAIGGAQVAYNGALTQVALRFADDTSTGGVGGVAGLNATPGPNGGERDMFVAQYTPGLLFRNVNNVTTSIDTYIMGSITSYEADGWLIGWGRIDNQSGNVFAEHRQLNASGAFASDLQPYPRVAMGSPMQDVIQSISSVSGQNISIAFFSDGTPQDLRTGQMGPIPNDTDIFLAIGEIGTGQGRTGLELVNFTVNNGLPIEIGNLPAAVPVDISIANTSNGENLTVTSIMVQPPAAGFVPVSGLLPTLPVDIAPGEIKAFVSTYAVQPATLTLGTNTFFVSAVGNLQPTGQAVGDNSLATIPVVGQTGGVQAVGISVALSRTTLPSGSPSQIIMTVTLDNQGSDPLTNLVFGGAMDPGLSTANGSTDFFNAVWTPVPGNTSVAVGARRDFRVNLLVAADMPPGVYSPAIVVQMQQGVDTLGNPILGTFSAAVTTPLEITSPFTAGPNGVPVPVEGLGLGNGTGTNSGCALSESGSGNWLLMLLAVSMLGAACFWRRA